MDAKKDLHLSRTNLVLEVLTFDWKWDVLFMESRKSMTLNESQLTEMKQRASRILHHVYSKRYTWKSNKDIEHLRKRKRKGHVPEDWTMESYNHHIMDIMKDTSNSCFLYFKEGFDQNYLIFGDGEWIVIIGEDCVLETAYPPGEARGDYERYLDPSEGYHYIGTIREVLSYG